MSYRAEIDKYHGMPVPAKPKSLDLYATTSIIWLNCWVLATFMVSACYLWVWIRRPPQDAGAAPYSTTARSAAIHTLTPSAAAQLFREFDRVNGDNAYSYRPWLGFSERPYHSSLVNIDGAEPLPTRRTIQARDSAPSQKTIWLFGGSTQYGWGVPDSQTIASHLATILSTDQTRYNVVNHGHTFYFSSQELILFMTLLRHGQKCDLAIFLDGLNDAFQGPADYPRFTETTAAGFLKEEEAASRAESTGITISPSFPPREILNGLRRRLFRPKAAGETEHSAPIRYDPASIYLFNISAAQKMADAENIKAAFFWQPTPFDYIRGAEQHRNAFFSPIVPIPTLNNVVRLNARNRDFHFIGDVFSNETYEDMYVDRTHYGDTGSRMVAQAIARDLRADGLVH